jgi:hypothetical protein
VVDTIRGIARQAPTELVIDQQSDALHLRAQVGSKCADGPGQLIAMRTETGAFQYGELGGRSGYRSRRRSSTAPPPPLLPQPGKVVASTVYPGPDPHSFINSRRLHKLSRIAITSCIAGLFMRLFRILR